MNLNNKTSMILQIINIIFLLTYRAEIKKRDNFEFIYKNKILKK